MDTARYVFAVLLVTFMPPALVWWLVVHPFVSFWRRVGHRLTYSIMTVVSLTWVFSLWSARNRLVLDDFGTHTVAIVAAALLMSVSVYFAWQRRTHLRFSILVGLPELDPARAPGHLMDEGIYARVRHPRYIEIAFGVVAYALFANYLGAYVIAAVTVPVLHLIVILEERELRERFGARYDEYCARVPRYVPRS